MPNKPRNSDGTIRQTNKPRLLTNRSLIARWVEAETMHLKRLGMSYQVIADHIMGVAQGQQMAMEPIPQDVQFPEAYRISIVRLPNAEAVELRRLDTERCEDMFLSLQSGIRKGDPRSVEVGVKVLAHKAEINGYKAPAKVAVTGKDGEALIPIEALRRLQEAAEKKGNK
jgi:hypothetical protein